MPQGGAGAGLGPRPRPGLGPQPRPGLGVAAGTRRLGDRLPAFPEGTKGYCSVGDGVPSSPCGLLLAFCVQDMAAPPRGCPPSPPCPAPCSPWLRGRPVHPLCLPEVLVVSKRPSSGACPLSTHRLPWVLLGPAGLGTEWSAAWMGSCWTGSATEDPPPCTPLAHGSERASTRARCPW